MSASLSPTFLADLEKLYATLRQQSQVLSATFLSDLIQVYDSLPPPSDETFAYLAERFKKWRERTQETVRAALDKLPADDPLLCPVSLFRTMDYGRLETAHTRALAWLLYPKGEHGFGDVLLAALLRRLAGDQPGALVVDNVWSEFLIGGSGDGGRLDLLTEGAWVENGKRIGWVLVIEAKIDASEGEEQLDKYDKWLRKHATGRETYRVFLTPKGRPAEGGLEEWEPISFPELVRNFREVYASLKGTPGYDFLRYYLAGVLQDICGLPRNVTADAPDPYAIASYLKSVHDSPKENVP